MHAGPAGSDRIHQYTIQTLNMKERHNNNHPGGIEVMILLFLKVHIHC